LAWLVPDQIGVRRFRERPFSQNGKRTARGQPENYPRQALFACGLGVIGVFPPMLSVNTPDVIIISLGSQVEPEHLWAL